MTTGRRKELSQLIKKRANELGFDLCGIARSRKLQERRPVLTRWLAEGMNGDMSFLERDIEKRIDPAILFPGTISVIVTGINYYNKKKQRDDVPVLSRYSYGKDYHVVISEKLNKLLQFIRFMEPSSAGKAFVDSAPVLEKAWAEEAGLGWQGRNSLVVNKRIGSFFFLGILLIDVELEYDLPAAADYCGECRLCVDVPASAARAWAPRAHTVDSRISEPARKRVDDRADPAAGWHQPLQARS
jgi:epoxyqueuosine reductase